jgi:hypothetical protein
MLLVIGCIFLFAGWRTVKGDPKYRSSKNKRIVPPERDLIGWFLGQEETIPPWDRKRK